MSTESPWSLPVCAISDIKPLAVILRCPVIIFQRKNHDMFKYRILLLIFIFLSGCAGLEQQPAEVKVTLVNLKMLESTLLEQRFIMNIRVQNRSPQPLSIHGMSFDIEINNKNFASGSSDQKTTFAAFSDAVIDVKMSSTLFGIVRQIQVMQEKQNQKLNYVISGKIYTNDFFGINFREEDEFDFSQRADLENATSSF